MVTHWYFSKFAFDFGDRTWMKLDSGMFEAGDPIAFDTIWAHFSNGANNYDHVSFAYEWDSTVKKWSLARRA